MSKIKQLRGRTAKIQPEKKKAARKGRPGTEVRLEVLERRVRALETVRSAQEAQLGTLARSLTYTAEAVTALGLARAGGGSAPAAPLREASAPLKPGEVRLELPRPGGELEATVRVCELLLALTPGDPGKAWHGLVEKLRGRGVDLNDAFTDILDVNE